MQSESKKQEYVLARSLNQLKTLKTHNNVVDYEPFI
jgi:hypothetical protein